MIILRTLFSLTLLYQLNNLQMVRNYIIKIILLISRLKHNLAIKLDLIGFSASTICAVHCALMPFILVSLPLIGMEFLANPMVELFFVCTSILIGIFTFRHGYFNHHHRIYPFALFITGLALIFSGHYFFHGHSHEETLSGISGFNSEILFLFIAPLGAVMIGTAHFINRKLSKTKAEVKCNCK